MPTSSPGELRDELDPGTRAEPFDPDRAGFLRGAAGTLLVRGAGVAIGFASALVLARLLGTEDYGVLAWALATLTLVQFVSLLGLSTVVLRDAAAFRATQAWGALRGLVRRSAQIAVGASSIALFAALALRLALPPLGVDPPPEAFWVVLLSLPALVLLPLRQSLLQAFGRIVASQVPDLIVRPALFLALSLGWWAVAGDLSSVVAAALYVAAIVGAVGVVEVLARQTLPPPVRLAEATYDSRRWVLGMPPLLAVTAWFVVMSQADVVIVGALRGADAAGIYSVANRSASLLAVAAVAVNTPLAPLVASSYALSEHDRLRAAVTRAARVSLALLLAGGIVLVVSAGWLLSRFGPEFRAGDTALRLLTVGNIVAIPAGMATLILLMSGRQRAAVGGLCAGMGVNLLLNVCLVPSWGLTGAALAFVAAMVVASAWLVVRVWRDLGVDSTPLGRRPRV
jgi:O-antigen/teichoic acid export membrane protein